MFFKMLKQADRSERANKSIHFAQAGHQNGPKSSIKFLLHLHSNGFKNSVLVF